MSDLGLAKKIERLHLALRQARIPHAFGGALALAYYATPRVTLDIDVNVFVPPERYGVISPILHRIGVDIPDKADIAREGQARMWWNATPIDLFFSYDEFHDAMRIATRNVAFGSITIPILTPEHLLVAKAVFDRSKDWLDIEQMLIAVDELDVKEVLRWMNHLVGESDPRTERFANLALELRSDT